MIYKILWAIRAILYKPFFGKLGMPSYIGKPIYLAGVRNVFIGKRVRIFPHIRMEAIGKGTITLGNNTAISQGFHVTAAGNLVIGEGTTIAGNVFVTDIDHEYRNIGTHVLDQPYITSPTSIGKNCLIGFGACIQAGTILGEQCIVGANSVVRGTYSPYSVIVGVPGRVIKRYNCEKKIWEKINDKN